MDYRERRFHERKVHELVVSWIVIILFCLLDCYNFGICLLFVFEMGDKWTHCLLIYVLHDNVWWNFNWSVLGFEFISSFPHYDGTLVSSFFFPYSFFIFLEGYSIISSVFIFLFFFFWNSIKADVRVEHKTWGPHPSLKPTCQHSFGWIDHSIQKHDIAFQFFFFIQFVRECLETMEMAKGKKKISSEISTSYLK